MTVKAMFRHPTALQNGASIVYVKEQMGHSSIQVTVDTNGHMNQSVG